MSRMAVSTIVARAVTEPDFRERFLQQPNEVLAEFDLSAGESEALRHLNESAIDEFSRRLMTNIIKKDS